MILVTAANGNQGKRLIPQLIAAELPVRACVSTQTSADQLRQLGVTEVVVGDICDPTVASDAVRGVDKIYHVGPTAHPNERQMGISLVDAARAAGVRHFVLSSVLHAIVTDLVQHEIKRDIEEHLVSSGLGFTILQPTNYMLPLKLRRVFTEGIFEMNWALDRYQSLVDLGDVTEVACAVLTDSARHDGATYELVSPGRYNAHESGRHHRRCAGGGQLKYDKSMSTTTWKLGSVRTSTPRSTGIKTTSCVPSPSTTATMTSSGTPTY